MDFQNPKIKVVSVKEKDSVNAWLPGALLILTLPMALEKVDTK